MKIIGIMTDRRKRRKNGRWEPVVTVNSVKWAIERLEQDDQLATSTKIAEKLNVTKTHLNYRLKEFAEKGEVKRVLVGNTYIYYSPGNGSGSGTGSGGSE